MELKFDGKSILSSDIKSTRSIIINTDNYEKLIPDLTAFTKSSKSSFDAKIKIPIGYFSAGFDIEGKLKETGKFELQISLIGHTIGSEMKTLLNITLKQQGKKTKLEWDAEVVLTGIAAAMDQQLLKGILKEKTDQIIQNLKKMLVDTE